MRTSISLLLVFLVSSCGLDTFNIYPTQSQNAPYTLCPSSSSETCYEGPQETNEVGVCKVGVHTCSLEGTYWGECQLQVLPSSET